MNYLDSGNDAELYDAQRDFKLMTRRQEVLKHVDELLDGNCKHCKLPSEILEKHKGHYAKVAIVCNKQCPIGQQLQALGKELTNLTNTTRRKLH
jgi:hypothetical protein